MEIREAAGDIDLNELTVLKEDGTVLYTAPEYRSLGAEIVNPFGRPMPTADMIGPLDPMATLDVIPVTEFGLTGIAPDANYRSPSGRFWQDVIVPTTAIFAHWPKPILSAMSDQMHIEHVTPDVAISTGSPASANSARFPKPGPGKPKKANGEIERACQIMYAARWDAGEDRDALHAEAAAYTGFVWNETLPRSTFQDYMSPSRRVSRGQQSHNIAAE